MNNCKHWNVKHHHRDCCCWSSLFRWKGDICTATTGTATVLVMHAVRFDIVDSLAKSSQRDVLEIQMAHGLVVGNRDEVVESRKLFAQPSELLGILQQNKNLNLMLALYLENFTLSYSCLSLPISTQASR